MIYGQFIIKDSFFLSYILLSENFKFQLNFFYSLFIHFHFLKTFHKHFVILNQLIFNIVLKFNKTKKNTFNIKPRYKKMLIIQGQALPRALKYNLFNERMEMVFFFVFFIDVFVSTEIRIIIFFVGLKKFVLMENLWCFFLLARWL